MSVFLAPAGIARSRASEREWSRWSARALQVANSWRVAPAPGSSHRVVRDRLAVRRMWRMCAVLMAAVAFAATGWLAGSAAARATAEDGLSEVPGGVVVSVSPGDTLWSIAGRVYPGEDRRDGIARIQHRNGMASDRIHAGQVLSIPEREEP